MINSDYNDDDHNNINNADTNENDDDDDYDVDVLCLNCLLYAEYGPRARLRGFPFVGHGL